jgi:hypothetical protein
MALRGFVMETEKTDFTAIDKTAMIREVAHYGASNRAGSWEEAARTYLAAAAIFQMSGASQKTNVKTAMIRIRDLLRFRDDTANPRREFSPQRMLELFDNLQKSFHP